MIKTIITGGQYDDPREYQDDTPQCKRCDSEPLFEDTHVCYDCCNELDEMDTYSWCCSSSIDTDINICHQCKEHSETALDEYCIEYNFNKKTYRYG